MPHAQDKRQTVGTECDWQTLSQVPVPGVAPIEAAAAAQDVEVQKLEVNQEPFIIPDPVYDS